MVNRNISKKNYLGAFIFTLLVFLIGIFLGEFITNIRSSQLTEATEDIRMDILDNEVQNYIFSEDICRINITPLDIEIEELSSKLGKMESQLGKWNEKVIGLKKPYLLLVLKQYFLFKERKTKCNETYNIVLFFYSNRPEQERTNERQAMILTYLRIKYGSEKMKIFAIDTGLDLNSVIMLRQIYGIEELPSLVINDELYQGFRGTDELIDILQLS